MRCASLMCVLALAAGSSAWADEFITYTLGGMFQGSITTNNVTTPLPAEAFSIALTADLNAVENNVSNNIFATPIVASVDFTLGSFGSSTYVDNIQLVENQSNSTLAFQNQSGGEITMSQAAFATYNMDTPLNISGVTVTTNLHHIQTAFGELNIPSGAFTQATFTVTETPEPASLLLVGLCLFGLAAFRRFRPSLQSR